LDELDARRKRKSVELELRYDGVFDGVPLTPPDVAVGPMSKSWCGQAVRRPQCRNSPVHDTAA
jgi:hypothetical protein